MTDGSANSVNLGAVTGLAGMIANKEAKKKATDPSFYLKILFA